MTTPVLYDYWRSSAAYRVRIALNLKSVAYLRAPIDLVQGEQRSAGHLARNPQGLVPALFIDGQMLTQSLAIIDYLDSAFPEPPLLSPDPLRRSKTLALALQIAADIHPLNNLRVLNYLRSDLSADEAAVAAWYRHWIVLGFAALEQQAPEAGLFGGANPDLADLCLVPQMANARRFDVPLDTFPRLVAIDAQLQELPAFRDAAPEAVRPA